MKYIFGKYCNSHRTPLPRRRRAWSRTNSFKCAWGLCDWLTITFLATRARLPSTPYKYCYNNAARSLTKHKSEIYKFALVVSERGAEFVFETICCTFSPVTKIRRARYTYLPSSSFGLRSVPNKICHTENGMLRRLSFPPSTLDAIHLRASHSHRAPFTHAHSLSLTPGSHTMRRRCDV